MFDGIIGKHIRRTNRNLFIANFIILGIAFLVAVLPSRYWYNFFAGPFPMTHEQLVAVSDPGTLKRYFVTIPGGDTVEVGRETETSHGSTSTKALFRLLKTGKGVLLMKTPSGEPNDKFTGSLEKIPGDVQSKIVDGISSSRVRTAMLPFMLDATGFRAIGIFGLIVFVPLGLLAAYNLFKASRRSADSSQHPIVKSLQRYGDPEQLAAAIDAECANNNNCTRMGTLTITDSWLMQKSTYGLALRRLDDVVWLYRQVTQHRTNGVPTGKTHSARIRDRNGGMINVQLKEQQVVELLQRLSQRVPWAITGFDKSLEKTWTSDRQAIIAQVDQRRQQFLAQAGRPAAPATPPPAPAAAATPPPVPANDPYADRRSV